MQPNNGPNLTQIYCTTITFSAISSTEFSVEADRGEAAKQAVQILINIAVARFDAKTYTWIVPIAIHDQLHVWLRKIGFQVDCIPRSVLATLQLRNTTRNPESSYPNMQPHSFLTTTSMSSSSSSAASSSAIISPINAHEPAVSATAAIGIKENRTSEGETHNQTKKLHPSVESNLAQFQKDGVDFIIQNDGRVLIADEMGLGKHSYFRLYILLDVQYYIALVQYINQIQQLIEHSCYFR